MNDRRHILTQDAEGDVALWDVLTGGEVQAFGKVIWVGGGSPKTTGGIFHYFGTPCPCILGTSRDISLQRSDQ